MIKRSRWKNLVLCKMDILFFGYLSMTVDEIRFIDRITGRTRYTYRLRLLWLWNRHYVILKTTRHSLQKLNDINKMPNVNSRGTALHFLPVKEMYKNESAREEKRKVRIEAVLVIESNGLNWKQQNLHYARRHVASTVRGLEHVQYNVRFSSCLVPLVDFRLQGAVCTTLSKLRFWHERACSCSF